MHPKQRGKWPNRRGFGVQSINRGQKLGWLLSNPRGLHTMYLEPHAHKRHQTRAVCTIHLEPHAHKRHQTRAFYTIHLEPHVQKRHQTARNVTKTKNFLLLALTHNFRTNFGRAITMARSKKKQKAKDRKQSFSSTGMAHIPHVCRLVWPYVSQLLLQGCLVRIMWRRC